MPRPAAKPAPPRYIHKLVMHQGAPHPSVDVEEIDLRERIAELEQLVAAAPGLERRRRESARFLVPPDEDLAPRGQRRLTKLEKRARARERRRHILTSIVLVAALIGLLNLLAHLLRA
jgi:hypothetical protein